MIDKVERISRYYDEGIWDIYRVRYAVEERMITPEEYRVITGEVWSGDWDGGGGGGSSFDPSILGALAFKNTVESKDLPDNVLLLDDDGKIDKSHIPDTFLTDVKEYVDTTVKTKTSTLDGGEL